MSQIQQQAGMSFLLFILLLALVSALILDLTQLPKTATQQNLIKQIQQLEQIKSRLMQHALAVPEIYATDTNGNFVPAETLASPGYLPCPDTNGDGSSNTPCGQGSAVAIGKLPTSLATRHFQLLAEPGLVPFIWYFVDSKFVIQNSDFNNQSSKRFVPLNSQQPATGAINLPNQPGLVAVLAWPKNANASLENPPNLANLQPDNYLLATLSHQEWSQLLHSFVQLQADKLCQLEADLPHWFNACNNPDRTKPTCDFEATTAPNPAGANWRELLC